MADLRRAITASMAHMPVQHTRHTPCVPEQHTGHNAMRTCMRAAGPHPAQAVMRAAGQAAAAHAAQARIHEQLARAAAALRVRGMAVGGAMGPRIWGGPQYELVPASWLGGPPPRARYTAWRSMATRRGASPIPCSRVGGVATGC